MRSIRLASSLLLIAAACGDDGSKITTIDAAPTVDAPPDSPPLPPGCNYAELADTMNDDFSQGATGAPEMTGLTFGATPITLCGSVNSGHFASNTVDFDSYAVNVPADANVYVTLVGTGLEVPTVATLFIYGGTNYADFFGASKFEVNHGVVATGLPAGMYEFSVGVRNAADVAAPIPYKIKISTDAPDTRCAKVTAAANFTEAGDGAGNTNNDVVGIDFGAPQGTPAEALTAATTDTAEATALTIAPATNYRITGNSANNTVVGSYKDRDAFEFTTGATTNEIAIRLNWPGTTADLDYFIFPKAVPSIGGSSAAANMEPEYAVTAVKPNTSYWVWVGGYKTNAAASAYDVSICGSTFTP